ncbi:DMT family transporter [Bradyrhizobium sp. LjRoot220]|uniref:DMT family transporter n=1 Tax=Bradyrhizobium sp. LjRoot220 TaxID=3342284 RepID=UPI003ED0023A
MTEIIGILSAVASSSLGGLSVGVTRLVVGSTDPITLGAFRFGIGSLLLLPLAWRHRARWPNVAALAPIAGLGLLYFTLFPVLFNASLIYTTAARGSLALSTLPLLTMLVAAMLHVETLTRAKTAGVVIATVGVAVALFTGLGSAPSTAWRGDLLMVAAALCMAFYSVWSRALARQYGAMAYTALAMTFGALVLVILAWLRGGFAATVSFGPVQWGVVGFLGLFGGALTFLLWSYALQRTTPTRVAISVTVNPIASAIFGAYALDEPITVNLVMGLLLVAAGISVASSPSKEETVRI